MFLSAVSEPKKTKRQEICIKHVKNFKLAANAAQTVKFFYITQISWR